ncbi:MAG: hypothetical protein WBA16_07630 [Nonlabens sp.]
MFKKYQAVIDLLNDLGVIVTRKIDKNLFPELSIQVQKGRVVAIRNNTPIFSGTDEAFDAFAKKIDEINESAGSGKKGKEAVDDYLDEIELYTNISGKPIDSTLLKKLQIEFENLGGLMKYDQESFDYISWVEKGRGTKTEAASLNKSLIMLGPDVSKSGVYEELIHAAQHRSGLHHEMIAKYGNRMGEIALEKDAAEKLIQRAESLDLDRDETRFIKKRLELLKEQFKRLNNGE